MSSNKNPSNMSNHNPSIVGPLADALDEVLAKSLPAAPLPDATRARMRQRIADRAQLEADHSMRPGTPSEPLGTLTLRAADSAFEPFSPGIERWLLVADDGAGRETALYRLQPGAYFESHAHTDLEECWVVEGAVLVGDYPVAPGELHLAYPGYEHPRILAPEGALLLIKSQHYEPSAGHGDSP